VLSRSWRNKILLFGAETSPFPLPPPTGDVMSISFSCSGCQAKLRVLPESTGKRVKCPKCGHVVQVLAAEPHPASPAPLLPGRSSSQPLGIADQLQKLHQLHEIGALSDQEFAEGKQAVLHRPPDAMIPEPDKQAPSLAANLVPQSSSPLERPKKSKPGTPRMPEPAQEPARDCAPITPKFARVDAREQHLYTFTLQPMFYTGFWSAFSAMGKGYGWQPDYARFVVHFTDQRILVESYDFNTNEKLASKGFFALAKFAVKKMATLAPAGAAYNLAMNEEGKLLKEMLNKPPDWFAIDYTEIATVEGQSFNNLIQNLVAKLFGRSMVKLSFRDPEREDLVFVSCAAKAGAFSFKDCNKEFIAVVGQLLKEKARFQSEPRSKQSENEEAARKRQKAEEPARNPWVKALGCLGFFLGIVLMCAGAFSELGVLLAPGMIVMFVGWFVWRPWGKDRKIASAWQGATEARKSREKPPDK
jgi:DNA-directed RNA polymerase subunit RPC12/RpoP